jgi:hypothetical protein
MTANQAEVEFWEEVVRSDPGRQALLDSARHIRDYMAGVYQKLLAELERKP